LSLFATRYSQPVVLEIHLQSSEGGDNAKCYEVQE
jgi:hypothetical protein